MRNASRIVALFCAPLLALALAAPLAAAGPELVSKAFDVKVANGLVDVNFALNLSDVPSYPVTITAILGTIEEVLYEGTLAEGVYRFSAPLKKISGHGELKVVLKTKVTNRSDKGRTGGDAFLVYLKWQGAM
jgi:hypothetical protein